LNFFATHSKEVLKEYSVKHLTKHIVKNTRLQDKHSYSFKRQTKGQEEKKRFWGYSQNWQVKAFWRKKNI